MGDNNILDLETLLEQEPLYEAIKRSPITISSHKAGWGLFSEEVAWFLYDFFKYKLNGYEKLIFYSYYITGLTLEELGACWEKTEQAASLVIIKINKKLCRTWKTRKQWKVGDDECTHSDQSDSRRNKSRSRQRRRS